VKILQLFNPYVNMGGEEIAVAQITEELEKHHELQNIIFDIREWAERKGPLDRAWQFIQMAYNPASLKEVREAIRDGKPDVILLHNIMPIGSAGLYHYLSRCGIPVIHYIHNFRPFSVNGYSWGDGRILTEGLDRNFLPEIAAGSWQESRVKTAWYGLLIWIMHAAGVYRRIAGWIAISNFMKDTFVSAGIDGSRISVIPHSWKPGADISDGNDKGGRGDLPVFLFMGRLSEEKGLRVLLDAWEAYEAGGGKGKLQIAGDGPLADEVGERCRNLKSASYLGFQSGTDKSGLLRDCTALVVPSVWWEPLGLVLYEAYDHGKPVLAASSGGIVDHATDGVTGWVHNPGNHRQLLSHMREVEKDPVEAKRRGENGRKQIALRKADRWIGDFDAFVGAVLAREIPEQEHSPCKLRDFPSRSLRIQVYLADQNPGYDRSFGISRMSHMVLSSLQGRRNSSIEVVASSTSQQGPDNITTTRLIPWGTRKKWVRLLTDHLHPYFIRPSPEPDIFYYPKGYLPLGNAFCEPSVVTIHDTIIQYYEDRYPAWRASWEYAYWARVLKHTLRHATRIMTVSEFSKSQITAFMKRHGLPEKEIAVTYEPCAYESFPQPGSVAKDNTVIHLASVEPHKRTAHLIDWWLKAEEERSDLPELHLIGSVTAGLLGLIEASRTISIRPFLEDDMLRVAYSSARAVLLPSEIEGFGLPALEAYYLGTPVCFVEGTSVEEILSGATSKGSFSLEDRESFFAALDEVMAMGAAEVRDCGLSLRARFASESIADRILDVFEGLKPGLKRKTVATALPQPG